MFVFVDSAVFILFSEFIMSCIMMFLATFREILLPSSGKVCECMCGIMCSQDRNILRSFLIGLLWLRICMEPYLLADFCGLRLMMRYFWRLLSLLCFLVVLVCKYLVI